MKPGSLLLCLLFLLFPESKSRLTGRRAQKISRVCARPDCAPSWLWSIKLLRLRACSSYRKHRCRAHYRFTHRFNTRGQKEESAPYGKLRARTGQNDMATVVGSGLPLNAWDGLCSLNDDPEQNRKGAAGAVSLLPRHV